MMIRKYSHLLMVALFALGLTCYGKGKIISVKIETTSITQYHKAEWSIKLSGDFTNPYDAEEISLDMVIYSPAGKRLVLPCYYDKTAKDFAPWKAAFCPREAGRYSYYFRLKNNGLDSTARSGFTSVASPKTGFLHANDFWTFKFDNGKLFRAVGENIGWEARSFEDQKYTYEYFLPKLKNNGGSFFRTWMCGWNMPMEWKTVQTSKRWNKRYENSIETYHLKGMERMDQLVHLSDSLGIYFMLTLNWHGDLRPGDYWPINSYNAVNGGPAKTPSDFFTSPKAKAMFKNRLRYMIARWGYSTSIAAWEFFNEVDNAAYVKFKDAGGNSSDSIAIPHRYITQWHDEMSSYLKKTDPYGHIVTTSISHRHIAGMFDLKNIDINQLHIYKKTDSIPTAIIETSKAHNKPFDVGEFGYRYEDANPKYTSGYVDDFKKGMWYGLFNPTPILPMTWWWEFFDKLDMTTYFKSVQVINQSMLRDGNGSFVPVKVSADKAVATGLKCGNTFYVYLHSTDSTATATNITMPSILSAKSKITVFDPERNQYTPLATISGSITLAPGGNTIVIIKSDQRK